MLRLVAYTVAFLIACAYTGIGVEFKEHPDRDWSFGYWVVLFFIFAETYIWTFRWGQAHGRSLNKNFDFFMRKRGG